MKHFFVSLTTILLVSCVHAQMVNQTSTPMTNLGNRFKRVIYIVFENEDFSSVIQNQIYKKLADQGARFDNFIASTHPSQGNYIAMIAGSDMNVTTDSNINLNSSHLGDLLERKMYDWKTYAEDYPGNCFLRAQSGDYVRKHTPFLSFKNVQTNSARCNKVVNYNQFFQDWQSDQLPAFSFIVPNLKNDGHDTSVDYSAHWLDQQFSSSFSNPTLMKDTLVILTYDEGSYLSSNRIYTVLLGPMVQPGSVVTTKHSHASLLKMIEDEWTLGDLGQQDKKASPIDGIWINAN